MFLPTFFPNTCGVFLKAGTSEDQPCEEGWGHSLLTPESSHTSCDTFPSSPPRSISHLPPAVYSIFHHSPRHPATPLSSQPLFTSPGSPQPDLHPPYLGRISRVNNPQFDSIRGESAEGRMASGRLSSSTCAEGVQAEGCSFAPYVLFTAQ